ncbi:unannotated protein [freshwater metagenome]|uniref:Unannotated protein n=1 Tax=freshwater metagenome TaxID=449393 RepID=A0A6J5Z8I1_9ZZZZ
MVFPDNDPRARQLVGQFEHFEAVEGIEGAVERHDRLDVRPGHEITHLAHDTDALLYARSR